MGVFTFLILLMFIGCVTGVAITYINRNKEPLD